MDFETSAAHLAQNLVAFRGQRGLTQAQLAKLAEVPRSTIANLETGSGNPTLHVLLQLGAALQLSIEELLAPPRGGCELFPAATLKKKTKGRSVLQKLLPHPLPGVDIDRFVLGPKDTWPGSPHQSGTYEYLFCEKGKIRLSVAGEIFEIPQGSVAAFPGDQKHAYSNPTSREAVGFSVVMLGPIR